jgi:hypothetical protein
MKSIPWKSAAVTASLLATSFVSFAHDVHDHDISALQVGNIPFPISCSKRAQTRVEHGLAMMHSFLFADAEAQFKAAAVADPDCAMAYWAQAMGVYRPLEYQPSETDRKRGWELIQKAQQLKPKTKRERDYVEGLGVLYRPNQRTFTSRNHEYCGQMERNYKAYPTDAEAAVFYALSLITWADSPHPVDDSEKQLPFSIRSSRNIPIIRESHTT